MLLPSMYSLVLQRISDAKELSLTNVIIAGEACPYELVARHEELLPSVHLLNE